MEWELKKDLAEELHKPIKRKFKKRRVLVNGIDKIWAADLVDMQAFSKYNRGVKYLLAVQMLAKTVLPALGVGALSGLASSGVQKAMGSGLYLKKGRYVSQVETDGSGLYLKPYKVKGLQSYGDGLYLKQGGKLHDGEGLLLGSNSPFANIPILGAIL